MSREEGAIYDPVSRLSSLTNNLSGTTNDLSATFAYNPASQITSTTRTGDAYAWTAHFNENKNGVANGLNQLTSYGAKSLTHDSKGNVTAFGTKAFTYSGENLLLTGPSSTLSYDPLLRLRQVTGAATTQFGWDGVDMIAEHDGAGALQRRYVMDPGNPAGQPIVWYEGTGTSDRRFLSSDERGSIISATDSSGTLLGINRYDEFGQPQSTNIGRFGYTGQAWLPELGIWYYRTRMYEPELGRFLQTDPIGYADSPNLYQYVLNDPVNLIDPLGLEIINRTPCGSALNGACTEEPIEVVGQRLSEMYPDARPAPLSVGLGIGFAGTADMSEIVVTGQRGAQEAAPVECIGSCSSSSSVGGLNNTSGPLFVSAGFKGERNRAAKRSGTANPMKGLRRSPKGDKWVRYKDQQGKWVDRPATQAELAFLASRDGSVFNAIGPFVPFPVGLGLCLLAPSTCGIIDQNNDGVLDENDFY